MKKMIIGFYINDKVAFDESIGNAARDSFASGYDKPWGAFAMSASDEFERLEKIEDIANCEERTAGEKIDDIRKALNEIEGNQNEKMY